jgi:uncharacterized protein (TIGR03067 family)
MRRTIALAACLILIAADGEAKKTDDPIAGSYKLAFTEIDGRDVAKSRGAGFTFKDGKLTIKTLRGEETQTYKLDPSQNPATIDLIPDAGPVKGKTLKGVYVFQGDMLKICTNLKPDGERPKGVVSKEGQGCRLIYLRKETAAKP